MVCEALAPYPTEVEAFERGPRDAAPTVRFVHCPRCGSWAEIYLLRNTLWRNRRWTPMVCDVYTTHRSLYGHCEQSQRALTPWRPE